MKKKENYFYKLSKVGNFIDSIGTIKTVGYYYNAMKMLQLKNYYYIFGLVKEDSINQMQILVAKFDTTFQLKSLKKKL